MPGIKKDIGNREEDPDENHFSDETLKKRQKLEQPSALLNAQHRFSTLHQLKKLINGTIIHK